MDKNDHLRPNIRPEETSGSRACGVAEGSSVMLAVSTVATKRRCGNNGANVFHNITLINSNNEVFIMELQHDDKIKNNIEPLTACNIGAHNGK